MLSVYLCVRFQTNPNKSHLTIVKRMIFRYFHAPKDFGLGYPSSSDFALVRYSDAN